MPKRNRTFAWRVDEALDWRHSHGDLLLAAGAKRSGRLE